MKRQQLGLTQQDIAHLMGVKSSAHLAEYERSHTTPSLIRLIDLSIILNEPRLDELFPALYAARHQQITARRISLDTGVVVAHGTTNNAHPH
jgi:transcriptional regulator with XRE-family HTH domain